MRNKQGQWRLSRLILPLTAGLLLISCLYNTFLFTELLFATTTPTTITGFVTSTSSLQHNLQDESNVRIPRHVDGMPMTMEERLRYLELKVNSFTNFGVADPFFGSSPVATCRNVSQLDEFGCRLGWHISPFMIQRRCQGLFDHPICLDNLQPVTPVGQEWSDPNPPVPSVPKNDDTYPCLVYDFGIREQPEFGAVMARNFGCEVHAFDPSATSREWWDTSPLANDLRALPNYHFHPYGAGGTDGNLTLNEYDWGQVSILKFPTLLVNCTSSTTSGTQCKHVPALSQPQGSFELPVKTLSTIRKELGHENRPLDVLKLDVEGSEFAFLEQMLDSHGGCPDFIQQLTLEWHHYWFDPRYGQGSSPPLNAIVTLLHACGLRQFYTHSPGGWPSADPLYHKLQLHDVRYNIASFRREHPVHKHYSN